MIVNYYEMNDGSNSEIHERMIQVTDEEKEI